MVSPSNSVMVPYAHTLILSDLLILLLSVLLKHYRRAVLVVNLVAVALVFVATIILAVASDDDQITNGAVAFENANTGALIFVMIVVMICYGVGAYGAIQFNVCMVSTALACHVVSLIGNAVVLNIGGIIMIGFFIYPHVVFILEMRRGIMTPDNYVNEVHSCCCV